MKSLKTFLVLLIFTSVFAISASARPHYHKPRHPKPTIGAPLDGGLLIVLGAAGAIYYGIRKKNKKNREL